MKKIYLILVLFFIGTNVEAQDMHFSQYWGAPMQLNPALTGVFNGTVRFGANYRNQWFAQNAYSTYSGSIDASLFGSKLGGNILGAGLSFYQDIEGQGAFTNTGIQLSMAYNQKITNGSNTHFIGLGLQGAYLSKQLDLKDIVYGNLFEINSNTDPIDLSQYQKNSVLDFNVGMQYFANFNETNNIAVGLAMAHVAQPNIGFNDQAPEELYRRISFNSSANISLAGDRYRLNPALLFQKQGPHQELNTGMYLGFNLNNEADATLYAGAMYRFAAYADSKLGSDAVIAAVRLEYNTFDIGLSYDITTSELRKNSAFMGGPEIYAIYTIPSKMNGKSRTKIICPKF